VRGFAVKKPANRDKRHRAFPLTLALICAAGSLWVGRDWWLGQQYRHAIAQIKSAMAAKRWEAAANDLAALLAWRPGSDEAVYLLGACELERGRKLVALDVWSRVAPGSAYSERAVVERVRVLYNDGRLAAAEKLVDDIVQDTRYEKTAVRVLLVPIYRHVGRVDDAVRLVEARWEHLNKTGEGVWERAIKMLRLHVELTSDVTPAENDRVYLDRAYRQAPDDDLVRLGLANLAVREGAYDQAERWIDACRQRRPTDTSVGQARLNWGLATGRVDVVNDALKSLPATEATRARIHRIRAWLCSHRGDVGSERRELELQIAAEPADLTAHTRLAEIAQQDGQLVRASEWLHEKAVVEQLRVRYKQLYRRNQPNRDAAEMAHLAQRLGRDFEARAFLTLAIAENPERGDLRHELARTEH
jgi:thioredoxin-like negative regulator of GroEL